jgi:predicted MFS family arabinose efflux permease
VPVAATALVWLLLRLPSMPAQTKQGSANVFKLMARAPIALGMLAASAFFMGQFMLFTYLRPFLETVTQMSVSLLSFALLVIGVAGLLGTFVIGAFLKNGLYRTLIVIPLLMAAIALALVGFGASATITIILLGLWGLVATAAPVGWWTWLARTLPDDAEAGGGLMVAIIQLAIAAGATVGGILFDLSGYQATFEASAVVLGGAAVLGILAARAAVRDCPDIRARAQAKAV